MVNNLVNNTVIPRGAAITRRTLIGNSDGTVHNVRTYYMGGDFFSVRQRVDTRRRGVLVADYKLPAWLQSRIARETPNMIGTRPTLPIENPLNQTAATAPVGTQGVLKLPVAKAPVALFGRPGVVGPAQRARFSKE